MDHEIMHEAKLQLQVITNKTIMNSNPAVNSIGPPKNKNKNKKRKTSRAAAD